MLRCGLLLAVCLDLVTGCGNSAGLPDSGEIRVTVATTGPEPDPDGFRVRVDGQADRPLGLRDSTVFQGLEPGVHAVELIDLAGNCAVRGDGLRQTTVTAGTTATVGFQVACVATAALRVVTTSQGAPADPDGYRLIVSGRGSYSIGANSALTVGGIPPGVLTLQLTDVAASCTVSEGSARQVTLVGHDTAEVTFAVHCAPPPPAYGSIDVVVNTQAITVPMPGGYTITLDSTSSQRVGPNDSVTFDHVVAGSHSLRLTGAPSYCLVGGFAGGANPVSVRVSRDSTSRATFGVLCLP